VTRTSPLGGAAFTRWALAPALIVLLCLFLLPLGLIAVQALLTPGPGGEPGLPLTLEPLARSLDPLYLGILWRSLRLALVTTALCLVVGIPVAWAIRGLRGRLRELALLAVVLPAWTNLLVKNYAWMVLLRREGPINALLLRAGVVAEPLPLLFNEGAVLIGLVHTFLPFMVLPLYTALQGIDPRLLEAARDLGAPEATRFRRIVLPLAAPGIAAGAILVFVPALGTFVTSDLLGGAQGMMIGNLIQNQMLQARDWPFGAALSLGLMAVTLLLLLPLLRLPAGSGSRGRESTPASGGLP
jgi:spermidine/putrescine transport system permease protein